MNIHHIAVWTTDLETMKTFYVRYFGEISNEKYLNPITCFESYFIRFEGGVSLELMHKPNIRQSRHNEEQVGLSHIAFKSGSEDAVISLTEQLRSDGVHIVSEPRTTGDGYFESVILDPEGNRIEIVV